MSNIIIPDIDNIIAKQLDLPTMTNLACTNIFFYKLIFKFPIMKQWRAIGRTEITGANNILMEACKNGFIEYAMYLLHNYNINESRIWNYENELFETCCKKGYFVLAQELIRLVNTGRIDIHYNYDHAFIHCCINGHINIAKWLVELGEPNSFTNFGHNKSYYLFTICCEKGHLNIVQWLVQLGKEYGENYLSVNFRDILISNCIDGQFEIIRYLFKLNETNTGFKSCISAIINNMFQICCKYGHI